MDWMPEGNCWDIAPTRKDRWEMFPETVAESRSRGERYSNRDSYQAGKTICEGCPVIVPCLDYAISNRIVFGVWGGMSPAERRRVRRRNAA